MHSTIADGPPVVWWDPAALTLEIEEQTPLRHQRILRDLDWTASAASQENYAAGKAGREALLARASFPSLSVRTVIIEASRDAGRIGPDFNCEISAIFCNCRIRYHWSAQR
jgi:hypothetical protein